MTTHNDEYVAPGSSGREWWVDPELVSRVAQWFHEEYERLAPTMGYKTAPDSAVPWSEVPSVNRMLMLETVSAVLDRMVDAGIELPMIEGEHSDGDAYSSTVPMTPNAEYVCDRCGGWGTYYGCMACDDTGTVVPCICGAMPGETCRPGCDPAHSDGKVSD